MPSVETRTSRAGKAAIAAMEIRQSHPSGSKTGSIAFPILPKKLFLRWAPASRAPSASRSEPDAGSSAPDSTAARRAAKSSSMAAERGK